MKKALLFFSFLLCVCQAMAQIDGVTTICVGSTATLSDGDGGGSYSPSWTSSNPSVASVNSSSGVVTGVTAGTATITLSGGGFYITTMTVNPLAVTGPITGTAMVCVSATTNLTDAAGGGTWSSGSTGNATVGPTGIVTGVATGTATISYTVTNGCGSATATSVVTVNPLPNAGSITGTAMVCASATTNLTDAASGGVWSSGDGSASVGSESGVVTGVSAGTATISYTSTNGSCSNTATAIVSVNANPVVSLTGSSACSPSLLSMVSSVPYDSVVWKNGATTVKTTTFHSITSIGTLDDIYPTGLFVTASGDMYVVDNNRGAVYKYPAGSDSTTAGIVVAKNGLQQPVTVCVDGSGNIYVGDEYYRAVFMYPPSSTASTTGINLTSDEGVPGISGISVDAGGNLFVAYDNNISVFVYVIGYYPFLIASGVNYAGIYVGANDTVYVTDDFFYGVVKYGPLDDMWDYSAGTDILGYNGAGNAANQFIDPKSVWLDNSNNIYVTDRGNSRVQKFLPGTTNGITVAGMGGNGSGPTQLNQPNQSCVDAAGNLYVTDNLNRRVQVYYNTAPSTNILTATTNGGYTAVVTSAAGCTGTSGTVTVGELPTISAGPNVAICNGSSTALAATGGTTYTWSPGTGLSATTGTNVTANPTATTIYTVTGTTSCGSNTVTVTVSVNALPVISAGSNVAICAGTTTTLNATGGVSYVWSADATLSATTGASVTADPTTMDTYTVTGTDVNGCVNASSVTVSVNALPTISAGSNVAICTGTTTTLNAMGGVSYVWSVDATLSATSGASVTADPTTMDTYTVTGTDVNGCVNTGSVTVSVNALPSAGTITGVSSVTAGSNITLADTTGGGAGSWSASNANATVSGGVVTGITAGTVTISYTVTGSCGTAVATKVITINSGSISGITGTASMCVGTTASLTDATTGGTWSSNDPSVATVGSTGIVTGLLAGTAAITYTAGGSHATITITVNTNPLPIQGATSECLGTTVTLTDNTLGGIWSSTGASSIAPTGILTTGDAVGTATVTYTLATGCYITYPNTSIKTPSGILGTSTVCIGSVTALSDTSATAVSWTSSNTLVATTNSGGAVTGVAAGMATITYKALPGDCIATMTVSVAALPATISGSGAICAGSVLDLSDLSGAGAWSSSNAAVASIGSGSGVVTGLSSGTARISYSLAGTVGCLQTTVVTVNAPAAITGATSLCSGSAITLGDATAGGTWLSSNGAVATIGTSGVVNGLSAGTVTISYTSSSGCVVTTTLTVNPVPNNILGNQQICNGSTSTLSDLTTGGTWSSSSVNAPVGSASGIVSGLLNGYFTITYTAGGCKTTTGVTVNSQPGAILGSLAICSGATATLSDALSGGTWSSTGGVLMIGSSTGSVTGITAGTATVSYQLATGCSISTVVTVKGSPGAILDNAALCVGSTITLSDTTLGGTWSSNSTAVATIGSGTGIVTGVAGGASIINYALSDGCSTTTTVSVNGTIGAINGATSVCDGSTLSLSDATTGGTWLSSNTTIATIGTSGLVTTLLAGTTGITYTALSGCAKSVTITVNASPSMTFSTPLCAGTIASFTATPSGGVWSSSNASIASVAGSTGVVTATSVAGTTRISYTTGGCYAVYTLTVNANPLPIQGSSSECNGVTITLSDGTAGGTWSANNTNISISGAGTTASITGAVAGTSTITYTAATTNCITTYPNTVLKNPSAIFGASFAVCTGSTLSLSDTTATATSWTSSNTLVATVVNSGVVTGVSQGTVTIIYKISTGCSVPATVTVNPTPAAPTAIQGVSSIAHGTPVTLSDTTAGGTGAWSSNAGAISLGSTTGITVTATANSTSGSAVITYAVTNIYGCHASVTKTITATEPPPHGGTTGIGTSTLYVGGTLNLVDDVPGGVWSSSDNGTVTVDETGVITGIKVGTANITHMITNDQGDVTTNVTPVVVSAPPASISLLPNPNKGTFTVKGTVGSVSDEAVTLEVTDVLGQVIYKTKVTAQDGRLNETVTLGNTLANGMYILSVESGTEHKVFHFVIAN